MLKAENRRGNSEILNKVGIKVMSQSKGEGLLLKKKQGLEMSRATHSNTKY